MTVSPRVARVPPATCNYAVRAKIAMVSFAREVTLFSVITGHFHMSEQLSFWPDDVSEQRFPHHEYYNDLMGGARRKPALPIGGPAVTRHVAFWCPNDSKLNRDIWVKAIEKYILALYHHLKDQKLHPRTRSFKEKEQRFDILDNSYLEDDETGNNPTPLRNKDKGATRYQTFRLRFYFGSMPASVSFELHDEYFTLSTIIDLAWEPVPNDEHDCATIAHLKKEDRTSIELLTNAITEFNAIAGQHYQQAKLRQSEKNKTVHRQAFEECYCDLYERIWDRFYARVFREPYKKAKGTGAWSLDGIFVDFRGFVTTAGRGPAISGPNSRALFIGGPESYQPKESLADRIGPKSFDDTEAVYRADVLLPWLKADKGFAEEEKEADRTEPVEFTCTHFLQKRVIFATALGAQLSRSSNREQGPMNYIVLAANQARWQMGRLIDRVHVLGTLRLAALYGLPHLIKADADMHGLDKKIDDFISSQSQTSPPKTPTEEADALANELGAWRIQFSRIEQQPNESGKPQIGSSVAHRVERSGYYQRQFEELLEGFRSDRIEGFPTYKEAVNRRLAGDYELIRTVGEHHRRLRETLTGYGRRALTMRALGLTDAITRETKTIEKLQKAGEVGFWAFLFPYYFGGVVVDILEGTPFIETHPRLKPIIFLISFAIGVGTAIYRSREKSTDDKTPKPAPATKRKVVRTLAWFGVAAIFLLVDSRPVD
jgi:hypothetical protein